MKTRAAKTKPAKTTGFVHVVFAGLVFAAFVSAALVFVALVFVALVFVALVFTQILCAEGLGINASILGPPQLFSFEEGIAPQELPAKYGAECIAPLSMQQIAAASL